MRTEPQSAKSRRRSTGARVLRYPRSGPSRSLRSYCNGEPRFVNSMERECAEILDAYGVRWEYEPRTFVLERNVAGGVVSAFTPDFYLPDYDLFIEVTAMKQSRVTRKNRKVRVLREHYPHVRLKVFYRRDLEHLAELLWEATREAA
jgi:hypothetical protein